MLNSSPFLLMARVIVLGGGFGGFYALKTLSSELGGEHEVILVDRNERFVYLPSLPYLISRKKGVEDLTERYVFIARRYGARFVKGEVARVDPDARRVELSDGRELEYDYLIIAAGATTEYYDIPGADKACPAWRLEDYSRMLEELRRLGEPRNVCIVGGGLTGLEVAGEMLEVLGPGRVTIVEKMRMLIPTLNNPRAAEVAERFLKAKGARIVKGDGVVRVNENELHLESGEKISCDMIVWAVGVRASPIEIQGRVEQVGRGRWLRVKPNLQLTNYENVYAIGDINHFAVDSDCAMKMAEEAILQGKLAARNIALQLKREKPLLAHKPIFLSSKPKSLISLGFDRAILVWEKRVAFGRTPYLTKMFIEAAVMRDIKGKVAGGLLTSLESSVLKTISR
uniref:FAD/NAD(P)-binding domain-containing protein n=1 Tax=Thermofilum pendens TaxID=2269 RepID=A0A7C1T6S7_THEPE